MPDIIGLILWPIKWAIEAVLVGWHWVFSLFLDSGSAIGWVLSIVGLVIVVRGLMVPLMVRQIKAQRAMMTLSPELKRIQDKYKGKKDQFSREAMAREQMDLYKNNGTSPFSSCMPMLVQMPIFFGLYSVLSEAGHSNSGVGLLTQDLATSFANAELFGAPLSATLSGSLGSDGNPANWTVVIIAAILVVLMVSTQFYTQLQIMGKNISPETKASPMFRQQRMLLYFLPLMLVFSGIAFPLGLLFYWFISNLWTMGQQLIVIRNMPNPGSLADEARLERLRRKGKLIEESDSHAAIEETPANKGGQRQQPVGKNRAKKNQPKKKGQQANGDQKDGDK